MFKTKMEENRLRNLQKSKSKFLSQIAANQMNRNSDASLEEKMERLINQAELLASFLLNKYSEVDPKKLRMAKEKGSASKRNRLKKSSRKKTQKPKFKGCHIF